MAFTGSTERGIDIHDIDAGLSQRSLLVRVGNYEEYVPVPRGRIDLQLMPEGGHAVVGQRSRVAYKAVADTGLGLDMTAVVTDDKGNVVAENATMHLGMGMFSYVPTRLETSCQSYFSRRNCADTLSGQNGISPGADALDSSTC